MTEADRLSENANVPHGLAELVCIYAEKHGWTLRQVRGECRDSSLVWVRKVVSREARRRGHTWAQIARALNRDHSTIIAHVRGRRGK